MEIIHDLDILFTKGGVHMAKTSTRRPESKQTQSATTTKKATSSKKETQVAENLAKASAKGPANAPVKAKAGKTKTSPSIHS